MTPGRRPRRSRGNESRIPVPIASSSPRPPTPAATLLLPLLLGLLVAGLTACGVQSDDGPRRLATEKVPYGLLEAAPATTTSTVAGVPIVSVPIYFVHGDRLRSVPRSVTDPATVGKAIDALLNGPRGDESATGLRTAVDPRAKLLLARLEDGVARLDMSAEFAQGPVQQQIPSLAQLVYTATAIPGVTAVRFTIEGEPVEVPTPEGNVVVGAVGRDAFRALAPLE